MNTKLDQVTTILDGTNIRKYIQIRKQEVRLAERTTTDIRNDYFPSNCWSFNPVKRSRYIHTYLQRYALVVFTFPFSFIKNIKKVNF